MTGRRIHPDYQNDRERLYYKIVDTLEAIPWTREAIEAYLLAQCSHGCLRLGLQRWEYKSAMLRWTKEKPITQPDQPQF